MVNWLRHLTLLLAPCLRQGCHSRAQRGLEGCCAQVVELLAESAHELRDRYKLDVLARPERLEEFEDLCVGIFLALAILALFLGHAFHVELAKLGVCVLKQLFLLGLELLKLGLIGLCQEVNLVRKRV